MIENFIRDYEYYKNVSLKKYNTYRLDVMANYLVFPKTVDELINLIKYLKENNIKYLILGGGSNVILARPLFDVVIKLDRLNKVFIEGNIVKAEAGVSLISLSNTCMKEGLLGFAFAGGIPGLVGASTAMNAGAYKEEISDILKEVKVLTPDLEIKTMTKEELKYNYRDSFLKRNKDYICLESTFVMKKEDSDKIKNLMDDRKRRRIESQPLDKPSAGSVFRNPEGLSSGKLIEDLGLKGYSVGGASVSEKHANFIINDGTATYDDIIELIDYIKKRVKVEYNIDLILEQEIVW